jgi:hypothetical protein
MPALVYVTHTIAMLAFAGVLAFAFFAARAGAAIHPSYPTSILVFFFLLPASAFVVSTFIAWRCARAAPARGTLVAVLARASTATLATTALLAFAVELTVRREMPGAIPLFVGIAFVGFFSLAAASALNMSVIARALLVSSRRP